MASGFQSLVDAEHAILDGLKVDIAVVDYDLRAAETGIQFIDRMSAKLGRRIPALVLSGGTDTKTLAALAQSGKAWLTKPADPDFIIASLDSVMKSSTLANEAQPPELTSKKCDSK